MQDQDLTYGFTVNIHDDPKTIRSLWPETMNFLSANPEYIHPSNSEAWLTDSSHGLRALKITNGYNACHFWSNFEIGKLAFWRSAAYEAYFNHLDQAGGFFYERWGDAPVHSVALAMLEDKSKIHW